MADKAPRTDPKVSTLPDGQGVSPSTVPSPDIPQSSQQPTSQLPDPKRGIAQPSFIVRGRVVAALAALNMYQVNLGTMGTVQAQYVSSSAGSSVFRPAAVTTATLNPGVEVWVALDPLNNAQGFILGTAHTSVPLASNSRTLSQYPQVAGLEIDPETNAAEQLDAKIGLGAKALAQNNNPGLADVVPGDWAVTNYQGGGVGVEAFRVWIGGGPMVGITFFADEETTRIAGAGLELITMAEEYEDRLMGRSLSSIRRRVDFPSDALVNNPPNLLETRGQSYAGESKFTSYRPKDNPGQKAEAAGWPDPQRSALIHEYRGLDGTFVLTAAASLTLQKWVGVLLPTEVLERPADALVKDFPGVVPLSDAETSTLEFPQPVKVVPERPVITGAEDLALISGSAIVSRPRSEENPLQGVANTADTVASIIGWQAARAFVNTDMWRIATGQMPKFMTKDGSPRPIDEVSTDPGMWKRVPKFFALNLNSYGASKRLYVGRAMISITDEGGILLQDAWGSQVLMAGGNIYLTAEHSIVRNAGRDNIDMSGRDHQLTAGRNVDAFASGGSASLIAGAQLTLVGGQSGDHGVLIHSKGEGSSMLMNGADEDYAAASQGIVLRSEGGITEVGKSIRMVADPGAVGIRSEGGLLIDAGDMSAAFTPTGMWMDSSSASLILSPNGSAIPLLSVTTNLVVYGMSNMLTNTGSENAYIGSPVATMRAKLAGAEIGDTTPEAPDGLFPGYLASEDYGAEGDGFSLPEPAWQARIRQADESNQLQKKYTWAINAINGGRPYPGKDYWDNRGFFTVGNNGAKNYGENYSTLASPAILSASLKSSLRGI